MEPSEEGFKAFGQFESSSSSDEARHRVIPTENVSEDDEHDRVLPSHSFGPAGGLGFGMDWLASSRIPHDKLGRGGGDKETSYPSQMELERNFGQGTKYNGDSDAEDSDEPSYPFDRYYSDLDRPPVVDPSLPPRSYHALYMFEAVGDTEMGLEEGQIVTVVGKERGDGWAVVNDTREGREGCHALVPESYLELVHLAD